VYDDKSGRRAHSFACAKKGCNQKIHRFMDGQDSRSTSNLIKHAKTCWGIDAVKAAQEAKDLNEAREAVVGKYYKQDGSITTASEIKGKGKVTYRHKQHNRTETRWVQPALWGS
jgi:hypothetical protein